jgi:hypothetical protein
MKTCDLEHFVSLSIFVHDLWVAFVQGSPVRVCQYLYMICGLFLSRDRRFESKCNQTSVDLESLELEEDSELIQNC